MKTEAKVGVMLSQSRDSWSPQNRRGRKDSPLEPWEGALAIPRFWVSGPQN